MFISIRLIAKYKGEKNVLYFLEYKIYKIVTPVKSLWNSKTKLNWKFNFFLYKSLQIITDS